MTQEEYDKRRDIADVFAFKTVEDVRNLLNQGRVSLTEDLLAGDTPLGIAVRFANYAVVQYLVQTCEAPVNLCFRDNGGEPPVKVAYDDGHKQIFDFLVAAGADLSAPGWMGMSVNDRIMEKIQSQDGAG